VYDCLLFGFGAGAYSVAWKLEQRNLCGNLRFDWDDFGDFCGAEGMKDFEIRAGFRKVLEKLDVIDLKVSGLPQVQVSVSSRLLPTVNALAALDKPAIASMVAEITGRARAYESLNLNDLVGRGIVCGKKQGRLKVFWLKREVGESEG